MTTETAPTTPAEELARALIRVLERPASADPWSKYPAVLDVHHLAEILGTRPESVSEAARRGLLPMRKRLGRWLVAQDVFRAWLVEESSR